MTNISCRTTVDASTDDYKDTPTTTINPAYEMINLSTDTHVDDSPTTAINPAYEMVKRERQTIHNMRNVSLAVLVAQDTDKMYEIPSLPPPSNCHTTLLSVAPPTIDVVGVAREEDLYEN